MYEAHKTWNEFFKSVANKDYSEYLNHFLNVEYASYTVYPPRDKMFNAFKLTPLDKVKVVIIGQDPYHEPNQAMGLSFSVPKGVKVPPSLVNIYKEIQNEYGYPMDFNNGDLTYLAKQGVLLLNSILSVRAHEPLSHNIKEYHLFLEDILTELDKQHRPMVFMLWGGPARKLKYYLNNPTHLILECVHPSPLAANRGGWFNNNHFKECNDYLVQNKLKEINWSNKKV
ncbi:MAG: uracil-DNA glycosylase [Bacilli bacterium]|nr:uracil-DNA glycosylase [Bacilli bacterium]